MIRRVCILALLVFISLDLSAAEEIPADYYKKVIFKDDFSAKELGKYWKSYKSESRVENGIMLGLMPKGEDHASVNSVVTKPFSDVELSLRFKFAGSPKFKLAFNDSKCKTVHAGHICRVMFSMKDIVLMDGKTGLVKKEIFDKKKAGGKLDAATLKMLKTKQKRVKFKFEQGKWYQFAVRIKGDLMQLFIDDKFIAEFRSEGIAHATKNKPALVVDKQAMHIDDMLIKVP